MTDVPRNRVTWFQIPAPDLQRALALYRSVFGWEPEDAVEDVKMTGAINGGIAERIACLQQPRLIIRVDDVDAVVRNVIEAGGEQSPRRSSCPGAAALPRDSIRYPGL
jgi:predicted enzyme related to lactoylglutathione lyase